MAEIDICTRDVLPSSSKRGKSPYELTIKTIESMKTRVVKYLPDEVYTPYLNKLNSIISLIEKRCS